MDSTRHVLVGLFFLVVVSLSASAAQCGGNVSCNCGDFLIESSNLSADIACTGTGPSTRNGLIIGASNVSLDCRGHRIYTTHPDDYQNYDGIEFSQSVEPENVVIRNCVIESFGTGFYVIDTVNSTFENNTIINTTQRGFYVTRTTNSSFANNTLLLNAGADGFIYSADTANDVADSNTVNGLPAQFYGSPERPCPDDEVLVYDPGNQNISDLILFGCRNVTVRSLNASIAGSIQLLHTNDSRILDCISDDNLYGAYLRNATGNRFENFTVRRAASIGVRLSYASRTLIEDSVFVDCSSYGTYLFGSDDVRIENATYTGYGSAGVRARSSRNGVLASSTLANGSGASTDGFETESFAENWTLTANSIIGNSGWALYLKNAGDSNLTNNTVEHVSGRGGLYLQGDYVLSIDATNTINDKPIAYYDGVYRRCPDDQVLSFEKDNQTVSHFHLHNCSNVTVTGLNVSGLDGVYLTGGASDCRITDSESSYNYQGFVCLDGCPRTTFAGNLACNNSVEGFAMEDTNDSNLTGNTACGNGDYGYYLDGIYGSVIEDNTARFNANAMAVYGYNNSILRNTFENNSQGLSSSAGAGTPLNNTLYYNTLCYNGDADISGSPYLEGDNNICDTADGYNDTGAVNCTHSCAAGVEFSFPDFYTGWNLISLYLTP